MLSFKKENYYPDRTYKNSAKNGTIRISKKRERILQDEPNQKSKKKKHGKSFINALLSTRWTTNGATIVVVRQKDTSQEAYNLAKQLQKEMVEELIENNRFVNDYDSFVSWFNAKEKILRDNNFHKLKG